MLCKHSLSTDAHRPSLTFFFFVALCSVGLIFVLSGDLMMDIIFFFIDSLVLITVWSSSYPPPEGQRPVGLGSAGIPFIEVDSFFLGVSPR